jgi:hypothetical protein
VDGILRNSYREVNKGVKTGRRCVKFLHAFCEEEFKCFTADMVVQDLSVDAHLAVMAANKDSVGKIELLISILRDDSEPRHGFTGKTFEVTNHWRDSFQTPSFTSLRPTQEIDFVQTKEQLSGLKLSYFKKNVRVTRIGSKPWAVLRFFYRTRGISTPTGICDVKLINVDAIINEPFLRTDPRHKFSFVPPALAVHAPIVSVAKATTAPVVPSMVSEIEDTKILGRANIENVIRKDLTHTPNPEASAPTVHAQPFTNREAKMESFGTMPAFPASEKKTVSKPVKVKSKPSTPAPVSTPIATSRAATSEPKWFYGTKKTLDNNTPIIPGIPTTNGTGTKRPGSMEPQLLTRSTRRSGATAKRSRR